MTATHVALLRGINVGTAKRVAMKDLRELVEGLGYGDVATLLNSGNVVFTVPKAAKGEPGARIEKALVSELGVSSRVTTLTAKEIAVAVDENPFGAVADDPSRLLLMVLADPAAAAKVLAPLLKQDWAPEALALGKRVAYVWCPGGVIDSQVVKAASRLLGDAATARNLATMTKLRALTGGA